MNSTTLRHDSDGHTAYQSTYRRSQVAIPSLFAVIAIFVAGMTATVRFVDGHNFETAIFSLFGVTVLLLVAILVTTFRIHRWTVQQGGVEIHQRPKVPLTGLSRKIMVPFPDIAAFRHVESGFEHLIEITTRDGRRFRLSQAMTGGRRNFACPDPDANLSGFALSIRAAAERAGHVLPSISEGLSFWNSAVGLAFLTIMLVISLLISGAVAWALWDGMTISPRPRGGETIAIFLLLPVGAGYLLLKSWKRRAAVRASLAAHRGCKERLHDGTN
jgi:hypothetical protein